MGTKMAVTFAKIFIAEVETQILNQSTLKPLVWKRYIDIFSIWNVNKDEVMQFIEQANNHHPTIKFTAEISETEPTFLNTNIFKGERFASESILDVKKKFKPTETVQYMHFSSCHPPGVKKGFIKGEALRLLQTNSSKTKFKAKISQFKAHLMKRGYPETLFSTLLSEKAIANLSWVTVNETSQFNANAQKQLRQQNKGDLKGEACKLHHLYKENRAALIERARGCLNVNLKKYKLVRQVVEGSGEAKKVVSMFSEEDLYDGNISPCITHKCNIKVGPQCVHMWTFICF